MQRDKETFILYYDSVNNVLYDDSKKIMQIPIQQKMQWYGYCVQCVMGYSCNCNCKYCYQGEVKRKDIQGLPVKELANALNNHFNYTMNKLWRFEFCGGEPLMYFNQIKELHKELQSNEYKPSEYMITTNGILLTKEITEWLVENKIITTISYDGEGQKEMRGNDLLNNREIVALLRQLHEHNLLYFNIVISNKNDDINRSLNKIQALLGYDDFLINSMRIVRIRSKESTSCALSDSQLKKYVNDVCNYAMQDGSRWRILRLRAYTFLSNLNNPVNGTVVTNGCTIANPMVVTMDIAGNILRCYHSEASYEYKGIKNKIGHISKSKHYEIQKELNDKVMLLPDCKECLVKALCFGGCVFCDDNIRKINCTHEYHTVLPTMIVALYAITKGKLIKIEKETP